MSLSDLLSDVKKTVSNRLFNLAIYKQTILLVFDYAGFINAFIL